MARRWRPRRFQPSDVNPYEDFVSSYARLVADGGKLPLADQTPPKHPPLPPGAAKALIFSPHPDDEVIIGGLPLRLRRETGMNVINVAVTQGSNKARQQERLRELTACCNYIGFGLVQTRENGLENVSVNCRTQDPERWNELVATIAAILKEHQPHTIFFPHNDDWNSSHIGTHHLVVDALGQLGSGFSCYVVETEFWGAMDTPNLMVESTEQHVIDLITALSFHVGEVRRNPYHVRMPAWMIDNVRRGGELVGGQGGAAPNFAFATLYRLRRWRTGAFENVLERGRFLSRAENPASLFSS